MSGKFAAWAVDCSCCRDKLQPIDLAKGRATCAYCAGHALNVDGRTVLCLKAAR